MRDTQPSGRRWRRLDNGVEVFSVRAARGEYRELVAVLAGRCVGTFRSWPAGRGAGGGAAVDATLGLWPARARVGSVREWVDALDACPAQLLVMRRIDHCYGPSRIVARRDWGPRHPPRTARYRARVREEARSWAEEALDRLADRDAAAYHRLAAHFSHPITVALRIAHGADDHAEAPVRPLPIAGFDGAVRVAVHCFSVYGDKRRVRSELEAVARQLPLGASVTDLVAALLLAQAELPIAWRQPELFDEDA